MKVLVTGSSGLVGSEAVEYYDQRGHSVVGVDSDMRARFFGPAGSTAWNLTRLKEVTRHYTHHSIDIRDRERIFGLFEANSFDLIVHCAAQPSHDKAREIPLLDFEVNALGSMNILEATRQFCPDAVFVHMSTNKVYGDAPNELPLVELDKRYDYGKPEDHHGIGEECRIDRCLHTLFGVSKLSADTMAQEYGRYFGLKVGVFRCGCVTGPFHSGVELHGFLSYLIKVAVTGGTYRVLGHKGKQVRDHIHSHDVIEAAEAFRRDPRPGEVYNLGGGRENSASILEAFELIESLSGRKVKWTYLDQPRIGDHICYISDLRKVKADFPDWRITRSLPLMVDQMLKSAERFQQT